ncbi:hypothetical protein PCANC_11768 [Puccinia coronata f. sp. avenae]|uniref:Uncharacterized protein n=1 Tax=Puccinia coronata f. sp. avenae TaxID=200324 RepID=A0A2N5UXY1_9BASI|nr:hypothetical protein PCANC_11768 [Puccinia coronata f. sp. avenae]
MADRAIKPARSIKHGQRKVCVGLLIRAANGPELQAFPPLSSDVGPNDTSKLGRAANIPTTILSTMPVSINASDSDCVIVRNRDSSAQGDTSIGVQLIGS